MRCIIREISIDDIGIDGEIVVVVAKADGTGYETTGGVVKVQVKSGDRYVAQDTSTTFTTTVRKQDLDHWIAANYPVALFVFHPGDRKLYWKDIRAYIKATLGIF